MAQKKKKHPARTIGVPLPPDTHRALVRLAEGEKRTIANLGRLLIEEGLARREQLVEIAS